MLLLSKKSGDKNDSQSRGSASTTIAKEKSVWEM
jgi:hypothetical protein